MDTYTCSWLNEHMNTFVYWSSRSSLELCPGSLRLMPSNICSEAAGPIEAKFYTEHLWTWRLKCLGHVTKMAHMPIHDIKQLFKIFFSETNQSVPLKFDMEHRGLEPWNAHSNDDPGFTKPSLHQSSELFNTEHA